MTRMIDIREAAHRLHKSPEETLALLKSKAFAGTPDATFPTVDPISLDTYIQNSKPASQRPLIQENDKEIAARAAWSDAEESTIIVCQDGYEAIAAYRLEFVNSQRTDYAISKHWRKLRARDRKKTTCGFWSWLMRMALSFMRRKQEV